ncbi:MAG: DUF2279 domain-containing protein [Putridiphycobacter sp.]
MKKVVLIIFLFHFFLGFNQSFFKHSDSLNPKRTWAVTGINAFNWGGSIGGLHFVWYKDFPKTKFHIFNDAHEWQQMDKFGHATVAYNFSRTAGDLYEWAGLNHKKSALIGGGYAFAYMFSFEMLDAYNEAWGFSWSDIIANTSGLALYTVQEYVWNQQFIKPKFSVHLTDLATYRPNVLGSSPMEQVFKDYNGQTYWLSFNPFLFGKKDSKFPEWINLSVGYGINHQLYGDGETFIYMNPENQIQYSFTPYREYYLSLDVDWEKIPVKNPFLRLLFRGLNIVKVPFPAIEFSKTGVDFHPFYF